MNPAIRYGLATAVILIAALVGFRYLVAPNANGSGSTESASASPREAATPSSTLFAASLPSLPLPGPRGDPPGQYGWEGTDGSSGGMHLVVESGEATAMFFEVGPDCLGRTPGPDPMAVVVGGFGGVSVEPYLPPRVFNATGDEITRAYALDVDGGTLCVFVTWHPTTSDRDRTAALDVLDSLRAERRVSPTGQVGIRISFTLRDRWDTG